MRYRETSSAKYLLFFVSLVLWPSASIAFDHLATGRTYDPKVSVEKRYPDTKGGFEVWLVNPEAESEKRLYRTARSARILFSESMGWVVVNDAEGSGKTSCKLFKRNGGRGSVEYEFARDLGEAAWAFFAAQTKQATKGLHHDYAQARCWLHEPDAIVISLSGHGDPGHFRLRDWTCVYLLGEDRFSADLTELNQSSVADPKAQEAGSEQSSSARRR